jgi:formylglycine-generating enzyme required for sulfatase activity/nucleoside phosphorylase/energy-coupling factor transporter ATP-binding protein EcfA2
MSRFADVGIIVALPKECAAMKAMVVVEATLPPTTDDPNYYYLAKLETRSGATYRVVIAQCPKMGNSGAAMVAKDLIRTFRVKHIIMVGIAAGVPNIRDPDKHVRLGDIVVSHGQGIVQYDMVKRQPDGSLTLRSTLPPPSRVFIGAVDALETERLTGLAPWEDYIAAHTNFAQRPSNDTDKLLVCYGRKKLRWKHVPHPNGGEVRKTPRLHYGLIGSGNCLIKDSRERDRLASSLGIIAIEMEGAGIADAAWNQTEVSDYLVVRGICDYADRGKGDMWQTYAALAAAAYTRALLELEPFPPSPEDTLEKRTTQQDLQRPGGSSAQALERYLKWVQEATKEIVFRGPDSVYQFSLLKAFTSLDLVEMRDAAGHQRERISRTMQEVDFTVLWPEDSHAYHDLELATIPIRSETALTSRSHAVIVGPTGSGKSTILDYFAQVLARSAEKKDDEAAKLLGLTGEVPIPAIVTLNSYVHFLKKTENRGSKDTTLLRFLNHYPILRQAELELPEDFFTSILLDGHSLVLMLDGLDEIADESWRLRVSRAIDDLVKMPYNLKCIVTTRSAAYHGSILLSPRFKVLRLTPLDPARVKVMIDKLCSAMPGDSEEWEKRKQALSEAIMNLEEQRRRLGLGFGRLVDTPLMVRIIMTVYLRHNRIAEKRSEVFRQYIDAVLEASYSTDALVAQRLSRVAGALPTQRSLLARLAFELQSQRITEETGLSEQEVRELAETHLGDIPAEPNPTEATERFMLAVRDRGGVFRCFGGQYRFAHSAFREFLAGQHIAKHFHAPGAIADFFLQEDRLRSSWWREPLVHCVEIVHEADAKATEHLIELLITASTRMEKASPGIQFSCLSAIGEACIECKMQNAIRDSITAHIVDLLFKDKGGLPDGPQCAMLGATLGMLGDPRPDVNAHVPKMLLVQSAGFLMGHPMDKALVDMPSLQSGQYQVVVKEFSIGKYPVTNSQFSEFVSFGGYTEAGRGFWTKAGWSWRESHGIVAPAYWEDPSWCIGNHPVVGVSWFEAVAYCRWLAEQTGRKFRLPTEAEWERAAGSAIWPWGDEFTGLRANVLEEGVGRTTCVGLFPMGSSGTGLHDVAGNVWEWCSSEFRSYGPYTSADGRESLQSVNPRCIRGGSWLNNKDRARNANRDHYFPGDRHFDLGFRVADGRSYDPVGWKSHLMPFPVHRKRPAL